MQSLTPVILAPHSISDSASSVFGGYPVRYTTEFQLKAALFGRMFVKKIHPADSGSAMEVSSHCSTTGISRSGLDASANRPTHVERCARVYPFVLRPSKASGQALLQQGTCNLIRLGTLDTCIAISNTANAESAPGNSIRADDIRGLTVIAKAIHVLETDGLPRKIEANDSAEFKIGSAWEFLKQNEAIFQTILL